MTRSRGGDLPSDRATVGRKLDRILSRFAVTAFRGAIDAGPAAADRRRLLQSAYVGTPYRVYEARTLVYSSVASVLGGLLGVYLVIALGEPLGGLLAWFPRVAPVSLGWGALPTEGLPVVVLAQIVSGGAVGLVCWVGTYELRWLLPTVRATARARRIDLGTPRLIAFLYALSRGGLEAPQALRILRGRQREFGQAGLELGIAGTAIELLGMDSISAVRYVANRTPSATFRIFAENFASVLQSSRDVSTFLAEEYEKFQDEAEDQQRVFLDALGGIAEAYVAVFVVGPLFLLTVLLIFGLLSGGTETAMAAIIYVAVPVANLGFLAYLDLQASPYDVTTPERADRGRPADGGGPGLGDGWRTVRAEGARSTDVANAERLLLYDRLDRFTGFVSRPLHSVRRAPATTFYLSVPLAGAWVAFGTHRAVSRGTIGPSALDDLVVVAALIALVPFAVSQVAHSRRQGAIEQVVPDFLNRLASLNEAGFEVVEAFDHVRRGDLGPLTPELERLWTDIEYGSDIETALYRMEDRLGAPSVWHAVTLIVNGMKSSANIGPVLRIAAEEAHRLRSLRRKREQELSIYLVIIYLSFMVFVGIVLVIMKTFIPAIPSAELVESRGLAGSTAAITRGQVETFTMLLFHAALIQGLFSGLVGGRMSSGRLRDGVVHVVVLLGGSYLLFAALL